jgi:4-hydroxy-2-oxoheptanedioate aldolase
VLLVVQVETRQGVAAVDEIAAVAGVDVVFVGPGDLALSLGCEMGSEQHLQAIDTVIDAGLRAGKHVGIFCPAPDQVATWVERGVRLLFLSSDVSLLGTACAEATATAAAALGHSAAERD